METKARHVVIGVFTLMVAAAAVLFALWLSHFGKDRDYAWYDIALSESVSGLSKGSNVEFNGIKVGEVHSLRLDESDARRVLVRVKVQASAPVRTDTKASQVPVGITGTSRIRFTSGDLPQSEPLTRIDGRVPVIVAAPSPFSKLLDGSEDMLFNANELLDNSNKLVSKENVASIARTLDNLERTSRALADQRGNMELTLKQLVAATKQAETAFTNMDRAMLDGRKLIDQDAKQTLNSAQQSMASMERSMLALESTIKENRGAIDNGIRGFAQLGPTLTELRDTLATIKTVGRKLEQRPKDYLLGGEQLKEFTP